MRILLLTGQLPYPPHAGGALRTYGLIDGLHRAGHTVDLITFTEPEQLDPAETPLAQLCGHIVTIPATVRTTGARLRDLLLSSAADLPRRFFSAQFIEALKAQLSSAAYDAVQMESLEMTVYLPTIRAVCPRAKVIYDSFNAEYDLQHLIYETDRLSLSRLPGAIYSFIQWRRLTRYERNVCQASDRVIAVSDADADAFRRLWPGVKLSVVPNGIYASEYAEPSQSLDLGGAALLFTGTMNYRPNVDAVLWFANRVLPEIRKVVPEARLFVVGNKPHGKLSALRQRTDVEITGFVQDVLPFLHGATVYVAPLRMGSGTRFKLLQAMAASCAAVSTRVGALGLDVASGREMLLADDADSFARAVISLLRDPAQRAQIGKAAARLVHEQYDWSVIVPRLLKTYQEMSLG